VTVGNGIIKFYTWHNVSFDGDEVAKQELSAATGFFIKHNKGTYMVTAKHALPDEGWESSYGVTYKTGKTIVDPDYDVAVVEIFSPVPTILWRAASLSLAGYRGADIKETTLQGEVDYLVLDIPAADGMSGSPVLDDGTAVAVLSGYFTTRTGCLCVSMRRVVELIERN
jgi:hypothetical protein